jgi:hypothetical protein
MIEIIMLDKAGAFAEDKEVARELRLQLLLPALAKGEEVTLDFAGVTGATQSFIHALISDLFRQYGVDVLDRVTFKNCTERVRKIIEIVAEYMQESL